MPCVLVVSDVAPFGFRSATNTIISSEGYIDLPAFLISLILTVLLVCGVRDSARFNNVMVILKVSIVLFVILFGSFLVNTANWSPVAPFSWLGISFFGRPIAGQTGADKTHAGGMLAGAALVFFAYIGFDAVSCHAEEARRPARDIPIAMLLSLSVSTALYVAVCIVITGQ